MAAETSDQKSQLRRAMGFWDVLLFNIAVILGPRWIAAAAHSGTSSISLWVLAAVLFFLPTSLIITELATRYPAEGGFYVWSKEAFGDFHGFVTGWSYWVYTFFYFPGLLAASVAMGVFIGGPQYAWLADSKTFTLTTSLVMLAVAVVLNIVGLNIGKWLQNAGGIGTYVPLLMLVGVAGFIALKHGSVTHFDWRSAVPTWKWGTVTFWAQIAFAFSGMELFSTMSEEVRDPQKNFPRAIYASAALIVAIYILGTIAMLWVLPAAQVDIRNGVFQAISGGSALLGIAWFGVLASLLVTAGNAGGVGGTVAGVARLPFVAGIDNYLPAFFGKIHPKWRTPWISILVQAGISAIILLLSLSATLKAGYLFLVDIAIILYYIPYLYMFASFIKLAYRENRAADGKAVLVPGGRAGAWLAGSLGFLITLFAIALATLPSEDVKNVFLFELILVLAILIPIGIGLVLYWRGKRKKERGLLPTGC